MNLIDKFVEFHRWPTSRKSFVLMTVAFLGHLVLTPAVIYASKSTGIADSNMVAQLFISALVILGALIGVSWVCMKGGYKGRWTAYAVVFGYGTWIAAMVTCFGLWSTPLEAWVPAVVVLVAIWYDEKVGLVGLLYSLFMTAVIVSLVFTDVMPYAPILLERDVGEQQDLLWLIVVLLPFLVFLIIVFALVYMSVVTGKTQGRALIRSQKLIRRYAPSQVADKILGGDYGAEFHPERVKLSLFFSDVEGFTNASDHLEPEELSSVLNQYLSEMAAIAKKYGATINQFVGDGIMVFFGAPEVTSDKDHAMRAVNMALDMQKRMLDLNDIWINHGIRTPFRARMGINTGYASVGDFGSDERKAYTAIGIQANIAGRIQAECEPGSLLITDTTWALVKDEFDCLGMGELDLKGVHFPVKVYEVQGRKAADRAVTGSAQVIPLKPSVEAS